MILVAAIVLAWLATVSLLIAVCVVAAWGDQALAQLPATRGKARCLGPLDARLGVYRTEGRDSAVDRNRVYAAQFRPTKTG